MAQKLQLISAEEVETYLADEWAKDRLYNIDYTHLDKSNLALYKVKDLSMSELQKSIEQKQWFLLDLS